MCLTCVVTLMVKNMKDCPNCFHSNPDDAVSCESCGSRLGLAAEWQETNRAEIKIDGFTAGDLIAERFKVIRELGQGGMGTVYLVQDKELGGQQVALKLIHSKLVAHPEAQKRFIDEVITCRKLFHSNIVRVHDLKRWQELRLFTMEYIAGRSLREWLDERKSQKPPFTFPEVISIIDPLLKALSYAHQHTIHRDIKPENIMVTGEFPDVGIKVLDFGIAKTLSPSQFSLSAQVLGTAYYMAPEQMASASKIDHRADLYSVGMVLYEMLTGEIAAGRFKLPGELFPELPAELDLVIEKTLSPKPHGRYKNADGIKIALNKVLLDYKASQEKIRQEEVKKKKEARVKALMKKGQSAMDARSWTEAEGLFKQALKLDAENRMAKDLATEAMSKKAQQNKLVKDVEMADALWDLEVAKEADIHTLLKDVRSDRRFYKVMDLLSVALPKESQRVEEQRRLEELKRQRKEQEPKLFPTFENSLNMKFVLIPPGTFRMGSPLSESGRVSNENQHLVTLSKGFYMQTTEVTQGQWKVVMGNNPSNFKNCGDDCPVETVSWDDAQDFIRKLNIMEDSDKYRLPTEAEWEYASRAGSKRRFCFGDDAGKLGQYAWYSSNSGNRTHPVSEKHPNAWGLYHMHGNVWEWCQDWYGKIYPAGSITDPKGSSWGSDRVLRGGSWNDGARYCRSANRRRNLPGYRSNGLGFRLALSPGQ